MNLDYIVEEEEEEVESHTPYSPPIVTPLMQPNEQHTLAQIVREIETSIRETFNQLKA